MKVFIISDHHFNHKNIIKFCKGFRPYENIVEMNEDYINRWNLVVGKEDFVIHLGDFGIDGEMKIKDIFDRLNGYKIIVKGNHDYSHAKLKKMGFIKTYAGKFEVGSFIFSHKPVQFKQKHYNFHGHTHKKTFDDNFHINVCVEQSFGTPISFNYEEVTNFAKQIIKEYQNT